MHREHTTAGRHGRLKPAASVGGNESLRRAPLVTKPFRSRVKLQPAARQVANTRPAWRRLAVDEDKKKVIGLGAGGPDYGTLARWARLRNAIRRRVRRLFWGQSQCRARVAGGDGPWCEVSTRGHLGQDRRHRAREGDRPPLRRLFQLAGGEMSGRHRPGPQSPPKDSLYCTATALVCPARATAIR